MVNSQIRDMPKEIYESLKRHAERDHRSLAQQALVLLEEALRKDKKNSNQRLSALDLIKSRKMATSSEKVDIVSLVRKDRER